MSLTLVGHAFTWLVADSPRARLSAAWCAPAAPIKQSAVSGYNSHPTTRYSPLPVPFVNQREGLRMGGRPAVKPAGPDREQQAPWAKPVRPGRNDDEDRQSRWTTGET